MNRTSTFGLFLVAVFTLYNGCKKKSPPIDCPKPEYYAFTATDLSEMPYTGKETLKFLYRKGSNTDTFIFKPISAKFDTADFGSTPINDDCYQQVYGQQRKFVYQNTKYPTNQYLLTIIYKTQGGGAADFIVQYDSITINDNLIIINNLGWDHYHQSLTLEGETFYAVSDYEHGAPTSYYTIYYTAHDGIIRMEYKNGASLTLLP